MKASYEQGVEIDGVIEPIAVVGMSGVFPHAEDVEAFWKNLCDGRDCTTQVPRDRGWHVEDYFDPKPQTRGKTYASRGGFVDGIDKFDPFFFEITPSYALFMDPSARLFLQEAWRAIEDAGYASSDLGGTRCGMYFCAKGDYPNLVQKYEETYLASTDTYVPARLAYHLNLLGPAVSIDTACSSTLTAIAYACDALTLGNCDMAIVGGGSLNATPNTLVTSSQLMLFSPTDTCRAFDASADGTVLGEAIGALVLKPISKARADGDHIYGLIKGWGTNQDGRTNGQTAPSAKSQAQLQKDVYQKFGIDPENITLIEAHGTGTKLGDPIEVQALTSSFTQFTDKRNFCALGSVKTNIGHAFFGAGAASVIKVLQCLRHGMVPPTLHFDTVNPAIKIDDSPFYVATALKAWERVDGKPRCAGVNAFGATGTNAHLVIEEYVEDVLPSHAPMRPGPDEPVAIVLSAKTPDRLIARASQLLEFLNESSAEALADQAGFLCNMAYTLQVGREPMAERLSFSARSIPELVGILTAFVDGTLDDGPASDYVRATLPSSAVARMERADSLRASVSDAVKARDASRLAEAWAHGAQVDWKLLYENRPEGKPRRLSLPTYPFSGERYWIDSTFKRPDTAAETPAAHLTPLLHVNASSLSETGFISTFSGEEFFFRDHVIAGRKLLPGVAYLEMAHAAVRQLLQGVEGDFPPVQVLEDVVWIQPFVFEPDNKAIRIALAPVDRASANQELEILSGLEFEIYAETEGSVVRHCQGRVRFHEPSELPRVDLKALEARCELAEVTGDKLYPMLAEAGFQLGPGHQGISELRAGHGEVVSRLDLPSAVSRDFFLHPSLLDSGLQTSAGLQFGGGSSNASTGVPLPFALQELVAYGPCEEKMWAWVRRSPDGETDAKLNRIDIDLLNRAGEVCVAIKGLTSRNLRQTGDDISAQEQDTAQGPAAKTEVMCPVQVREPGEPLQASDQVWHERYVLFVASEDAMEATDLLEARDDIDGVVRKAVPFQPKAGPEVIYPDVAQCLLETLQSLLRRLAEQRKRSKRSLLQLVIHPTMNRYYLEALGAFLRSAAAENSKLAYQTILVADELSNAEIAKCVNEEAHRQADVEISYSNEGRFVRRLNPVDSSAQGDPTNAEQPWHSGGVYFLAGGLGSLGLMMAKQIATTCDDAVLILTGRRKGDHAKQQAVAEIKRLGATVICHELELSDGEAVQRLVTETKREHGSVDGVFHFAGALRDSYILQKSSDDLRAVFAPKVQGLINLDRATVASDLDFFIGFSSLAGVWGNAGQSDYAAANAFMDAYLCDRQRGVEQGTAQGKTLSINWPLWREGGMTVDPAYEQMMANMSGLVPLSSKDGIAAFYQAWRSGEPQVAVLNTRTKAEPKAAPSATSSLASQEKEAAGAEETDLLAHQMISVMRGLVAKLIKTDMARIDADVEMSDFGLDSITLTKLSNALHDSYQISLSPTIFFEHSTISDLSHFMAEEFADDLAAILNSDSAEPQHREDVPAIEGEETVFDDRPRLRHGIRIAADNVAGAAVAEVVTADRKKPTGHLNSESPRPNSEPVAVIGISAQFPMAADHRAFWRNLLDEKDCITEIPKDRWDWRQIYGDPHQDSGLTNIKWGGFIDGVGDWDPAFFSVSPREAELMDPQKRLLLTHVWKAIEDAGYAPSALWGSNTALFIGTSDSGYATLYKDAGLNNDGSGTPASMGPNRVSYFLNFHGPSEPVETACSSSLVAIGRAVRLLRDRACDLTIAGGIQLIPTPAKHISFSQAGILSEDGRCKTFSDKANGYVRAEGIGMLVLKRLADAERDGDAIYGVIRGAAENHGGRANSLTAPNPRAQAKLLESAYQDAGIDPRTVGYIEAHGTGTMLGDPIEINGLKSAFRTLYAQTDESPEIDREPGEVHCALGSVKSNIGHAELAAGVAGVIKVLLQMKQRTLVSSLHCDAVNPHIDLSDSPFEIIRETRAWEPFYDRTGKRIPLRAGVSSFGVGGVNAHVVLEEYA